MSYIDHSWNETTNTLNSVTRTVTKYTVLTGQATRPTQGWYVARGTLTYEARLTVSGDVHLILGDGCKVIAKQGIDVSMESAQGSGGIDPAPNTLAIYAQSEGLNIGRLEAEPANNNAAIGAANGKSGGPVMIYGGSVTATAASGAGIGGSYNGAGTVAIYGGSVTASAKNYGAAIGGGQNGTGTVTIYGGSVTASATGYGAAIGGGQNGTGTVTIYGGSVTASARSYGVAIGGGHNGTGTVTIYGGSVTASATGYGAAIGGGHNGTGTVKVNGGHVEAHATGGSAVIDGGNYGAGEVTVNGGQVYAVHTTRPGITVRAHVIALGLTEAADFMCASGYDLVKDEQSNEEGRLTLAKSFRSADSGTQYAARDWSSSDLAGQLLIPDTDDAATLHFWPAKPDFTLPAGLTEVGVQAFQGVSAGTVLVPAGVTTVGANAFSDSGLQKIRFLGEHTIVDATAFAGCGDITAFAIPGTDTWMSLGDIPGIALLPMT
ncbi:MAG: leucine-rich repeat protein [Clostridia bacterium]|nr:leucine-rich repeat protein [Clostridia bacterium]